MGKNHGLVHRGENMGQVDWITLGDKDVELQGSSKWNYGDLVPEEVCRRTRACSRLRNNGLMQSPAKEFAVDDVYEFQANDDIDFKEDINGDPDFEFKKEMSNQGKSKGKAKKIEKVGGGRGRPRKNAKVENNPSIDEYYSPVKTENTDYEKMLMEAGNVSPSTAVCNRPGLSEYRQGKIIHPVRNLPRNKKNMGMGECPLCDQKFDMVLLESHAS